MTEFIPVTNKEIRRQAWKAARQKFWPFVGFSFVFALILVPLMLAGMLLTEFVPALGVVVMIALFVIYPGLIVGMQQYICNVWHGLPAGVGTLFSRMKSTGRAWGVLFLMCAMMFGVMIPIMFAFTFTVFLPSETGMIMSLMMTVLSIGAFILLFWLMMRFSVALVCIVVRPGFGVFECMGASWRATRGNFWRIFGHNFMLSLPILALTMATEFVGVFLFDSANELLYMLVMLAAILPQILFTFYYALGTFGLAEHLLDAACPLPSEEPDPNALPAAEEYEDEYEDADDPEDEEEYEDIPEDEPTDDEPKEDPDTL